MGSSLKTTTTTTMSPYSQRARKVVSDSPGLVDFAIGLVIFFVNFPDFWGKFKLQKDIVINLTSQKGFWG